VTAPRVRAPDAPTQDDLVPLEWTFIGDWRTDDGIGFELYIDPYTGAGRLIGIHGPPPNAIAANITDAPGRFAMSWTGEIDRPADWRKDQEAVARSSYAEYRRRPSWDECTIAESEELWARWEE
jgi:hypothetical protein